MKIYKDTNMQYKISTNIISSQTHRFLRVVLGNDKLVQSPNYSIGGVVQIAVKPVIYLSPVRSMDNV